MIIILSEIYYDNKDHKQYDFGNGSTSIIHSYVYVRCVRLFLQCCKCIKFHKKEFY